MTYTFEVIKADNCEQEDYDMALSCLLTSIESVLYDYKTKVTLVKNTISIKSIDGALSYEKCKNKIKNCFMDSTKRTYSEFEIINPAEDQK